MRQHVLCQSSADCEIQQSQKTFHAHCRLWSIPAALCLLVGLVSTKANAQSNAFTLDRGTRTIAVQPYGPDME